MWKQCGDVGNQCWDSAPKLASRWCCPRWSTCLSPNNLYSTISQEHLLMFKALWPEVPGFKFWILLLRLGISEYPNHSGPVSLSQIRKPQSQWPLTTLLQQLWAIDIRQDDFHLKRNKGTPRKWTWWSWGQASSFPSREQYLLEEEGPLWRVVVRTPLLRSGRVLCSPQALLRSEKQCAVPQTPAVPRPPGVEGSGGFIININVQLSPDKIGANVFCKHWLKSSVNSPSSGLVTSPQFSYQYWSPFR